MDARELRIGNCVDVINRQYEVHLPSNTVFTLQEISHFYAKGIFPHQNVVTHEWTEIRMSDLTPIPLTEEWLLKFGFDKNYLLFDDQQIYISIEDGEYHLFGGDSVTSGQCFIGKIQYVHQLQNLYFALTGNEIDHTDARGVSLHGLMIESDENEDPN